MDSILYVFLPCKKVYPIGITYLADFIHRRRPDVRQQILDLSLFPVSERSQALRDAATAFKPDLVCFSWRDIQIFSPHEGDSSLEHAFNFYFASNPIKRVVASFEGLKQLYRYYSHIYTILSYPWLIRKEFPKAQMMIKSLQGQLQQMQQQSMALELELQAKHGLEKMRQDGETQRLILKERALDKREAEKLMVKREDVVISTKVGIRMSPAQNDQGTGRKHLMSAIDLQLKRLQTDYIDVYQVHRLDPYTPIEETMYTLDQIVRSGKVRYIGGSTMPAYRFAQMCMLADWKGYAKPIAMQNLYNLIAREEEKEMNPLCLEQGVGLIPYSPLARGFLAANRSKEGGGATERSKNDVNVKPDSYRECDWEIAERLKKVAAGRNCSPAQAAARRAS
mgnify:CR=1 FL=1